MVPERSDDLIIAVANQKGGVGKSTTTVALSINLQRMGFRVGVIDLDPQANTTETFGLTPDQVIEMGNMFGYMEGSHTLWDAFHETPTGVWLAPSHIGLAHTERSLYAEVNREKRLAHQIEPLRVQFDAVLIDSPPSLGVLTYNALAACDTVLAPIQSEPYALNGLNMLLETISEVKRYGLNDNCELGGAVLTLADRRRNVDTRMIETLREALDHVAFETIIPRDVRMVEMAEQADLSLLDGDSNAAVAYRNLAKEVSDRWLSKDAWKARV